MRSFILKLSLLSACRCYFCLCLRCGFACFCLSCCWCCSSSWLLLVLLLLLSVADILQDLLGSGNTSSGFWCLKVENFFVGVDFRMKDDSRRKSVGEISNSIWSINVDIANINKELCWVFMIIADNIQILHIVLDAETCMVEFVEF